MTKILWAHVCSENVIAKKAETLTKVYPGDISVISLPRKENGERWDPEKIANFAESEGCDVIAFSHVARLTPEFMNKHGGRFQILRELVVKRTTDTIMVNKKTRRNYTDYAGAHDKWALITGVKVRETDDCIYYKMKSKVLEGKYS